MFAPHLLVPPLCVSPATVPPPPGNLAAIRAVTKKATRLTYDLATAKANAPAGCTAGVRYM